MAVKLIFLNGTDITTYKLHLRSYDGAYDIPARKPTIDTWGTEDKDIKFMDRNIVFEFVGVYDSPVDLGTCIKQFTDKVLSKPEGVITIYTPGEERPDEMYIGRLTNGAQVDIQGRAAFITLTMTYQGKTHL